MDDYHVFFAFDDCRIREVFMRGDVLLFLVFSGFAAVMQVGNMACSTVTGKRPTIEQACLKEGKELLVVAGNHRATLCDSMNEN